MSPTTGRLRAGTVLSKQHHSRIKRLLLFLCEAQPPLLKLVGVLDFPYERSISPNYYKFRPISRLLARSATNGRKPAGRN